ncbi:hypothetical protein BMJ21_30520 [Sinorhizobium medicae]|nr:hypothetical protein BMJ21_30520 [Sinorhizobium medicae]
MTLKRRRENPSGAFRPAIDPSSAAPLPRQLYLSLRNAIAGGRLTTGQRLPSTRLASMEWRISRGVIAEAYEILIAEGFAVARHGSGTYIASSIPDRVARGGRPAGEGGHPIRRSVSSAATTILTHGPSLEPQKTLPFVTGRIAHDERTARLLNRIGARHMNYAFAGYGDIQGEKALRAAISAHLAVSRGVRCTAEQVFITAGTQQALGSLTLRPLHGRTGVHHGRNATGARPCLSRADDAGRCSRRRRPMLSVFSPMRRRTTAGSLRMITTANSDTRGIRLPRFTVSIRPIMCSTPARSVRPCCRA